MDDSSNPITRRTLIAGAAVAGAGVLLSNLPSDAQQKAAPQPGAQQAAPAVPCAGAEREQPVDAVIMLRRIVEQATDEGRALRSLRVEAGEDAVGLDDAAVVLVAHARAFLR